MARIQRAVFFLDPEWNHTPHQGMLASEPERSPIGVAPQKVASENRPERPQDSHRHLIKLRFNLRLAHVNESLNSSANVDNARLESGVMFTPNVGLVR